MGETLATRDQLDISRLVARLVRRYRKSEPDRPAGRSGPASPPLLCLIRQADEQSPLDDLARRLGGTKDGTRWPRRVPHARITFPHTVNPDKQPFDEQVLALLEQIRAHFSVERFGADPLVFRHFMLAKLLMQLKINNDGNAPEPRKLVAKVLRDRFGRPWGDRLLATDETTSVSLVWLVFNLVRTSVPAAVLRIRATGRIPGLSGKFRWFMRQPYMHQQTEPILRIIVANAGRRMGFAAHTVEMLRPLVRGDASIAGVVGLDQTYVSTVAAIQVLTGLGLPMISPTLSADRLDETSPLYYQITQPNAREADIFARYAKQSGFRTARILYPRSEGDDLYVESLRTAVRNALTNTNVSMDDDLDWSNSASPLGPVCEYTGMLFYAGRDTDFESFLHEFDNQCQNQKPKYPIVAGDSVSRLIEDPERRAATESKRPLMYVSDAHLVDCQSSVPRYDTWKRFLDETKKEPWRACAKDSRHPLSERMELAYDATYAFLLAVSSLTPLSSQPDQKNPMLWRTGIPLSPDAVWQRLGTVHFDGVTGYLNFTNYYCGGVVEQDPGPPDDCTPGTRPR